MPARLNEFRLPTDCWAVLHEFLREVHAIDAGVLARLHAAVPTGRLTGLDDRELLAATRAFIRDGDPDETLQAIWTWAEDHRLVRPLEWLRGRAPWQCVESYSVSNYCRSLLCMAVELVRRRHHPSAPFSPFGHLAGSPLRFDPAEVEEYIALAGTARHISPADLGLIASVLREPTPRPLGDAEINALLLAGAVPVGDEHNFAALARYQVGLRSADRIARELFPVPSNEPGAKEKEPPKTVSRQVIDRWIRGAARLLVGPVPTTAWLRDPIPAGRPRKDASKREQ
jgi:hypothetical protein